MSRTARLSLAVLFAGTVAPLDSLAWEIGGGAHYADAAESLIVNARRVQLRTGGVGFKASKALFSNHLEIDGAILHGYTGSASATFSGAAVSGPAQLATYRGNATLSLLPQRSATPYLRLGWSQQAGDTSFTGARGNAPVRGTANLRFDTRELAFGARTTLGVFNASLFGEVGRFSWRLDSDASGVVGALGARTRIQADNTDSFAKIGLSVPVDNWRGALSVSQHRMTADNRIVTRSFDATVVYAF